MFVNDRRNNWHELLPFVMHAYRTSVHESTGYSPFWLMMGEECSLPQDVYTDELRAHREHDVAPHPFATWVHDALVVAYDHVKHTLQRTSARRKRLYDVMAVNRKFPVGSWVLRYYPPAAQKKLGSPWVGPQQVVRQATGHTVGIQRGPDTPIIFIHVHDLKICPAPANAGWTPGPSTAKSLCASTVAFRPGSVVSDSEANPSVIVSTCNNTSHTSTRSAIHGPYLITILCEGLVLPRMLIPLNRTSNVFSLCCATWTPAICYQCSEVDQIPHRFQTPDWQVECRTVLTEIYSHLCLSDMAVETALIDTGPRPFCLQCSAPWGALCNTTDAVSR